TTVSTVGPASAAAFSGLRTRARSGTPCVASWRTTAPPTSPVAPVTRIIVRSVVLAPHRGIAVEEVGGAREVAGRLGLRRAMSRVARDGRTRARGWGAAAADEYGQGHHHAEADEVDRGPCGYPSASSSARCRLRRFGRSCANRCPPA